ncbi:uncharacterized protein K489DRAFT_318752 [Dissoconium aciculare CBS 342.82]|uniref:Spindle pole body component n=1 Tax=Dissoconium aciculare CBS 342.82 TaxID=1314786 RepID=A0A6J3M559_9PEZI|nr:uncharacterized protein K489DRAFT_318752 [Dissoconium aciculare CBS 342.82]KAF1823018.1 hypothetical protein K489DRAFT_318752 [Dissoconium aciculare CBS 342.82]
MAHAAIRRDLVENLVTGVTGIATEDHTYIRLCAQSVKALRDQGHARTNQFTVQARLEGLTEKFGVLNREDLAEALQSRLDELSSPELQSKWLPEIFALLLELSDRPAEKTSREPFKSIKGAASQRELSWQEILAADPLEDDGMWDDVERGYHSSGDEMSRDDLVSEKAPSTSATSNEDTDDPLLLVQPHLIHTDKSLLVPFRQRQGQGASVNSKTTTCDEYSVVREVLMMLRGLPTDQFHRNDVSGGIKVSRSIIFTGTSELVIRDLVAEAARIGTNLNHLRSFVRSEQPLAYMQSVQNLVSNHLSSFASHLDQTEASFVSNESSTIVSVLQVMTRVRKHAAPLLSLSTAIARVDNKSADPTDFGLLDSLYDLSCMKQATGDLAVYNLSVDVFLAGLRTYMLTVARWICTATINDKDRDMFFVVDADSTIDLGSLWHGKFSLRSDTNGSLAVPQFLTRFATNIFALGKSKYFLQQLSGSDERDHLDFRQLPGLMPNFDAIERKNNEPGWMPFSQILEESLDSWIRSLGTSYVSHVQSLLLNEQGLLMTLSALPTLFLAKNGSLFQALADGIIPLMATTPGDATNANSHLATMLARDVCSSSPSIEDRHLFVDVSEASQSRSSIIARLGNCRLFYKVPWPVQNVIRSKTPELHSQIFAFLLQAYHARSLLESTFLDLQRSSTEYPATLKLRQRLLWFAGLLHNHVTTTANQLHDQLRKDMATSESIDSMVDVWSKYTSQLQLALLLTPSLEPVRDAVINILELSELLSRARGPASIAGLLAQFERNLAFLMAGVRGVGRAGGQFWLEAFAERLDWQQID